MADTIDKLQIEINAKAQNANNTIDRLVGKLDRLTTSLGRVNGTNLNGLANGVQRLGNAMQVMNTIKTADFTRLATNLTRLGTVNVSALNSAASSMSHLTRAFNSLGTVSANAQSVGEMAKNIAKLGNKSVQTAITNIPQLAKAMNNLMATLSKSPKVSRNVIQMTNALANLANQGSKVGSASNSIVRGLNRTSTSANTAKKSFGGLASAIGKFYATYFMVIRGLKGLWSSVKSTADYIEAYNYFNVSLGKIGADWSHQYEQYGYDNAESYAESFKTRLSDSLSKLSGLQVSIGADGQGLLTESGMKNLGLNIQEITQYASQLASVTNSVGQTGEVSLAVASSFSKLAGDISSLFNVDYSSVSKNLQSGLIGQSRALYKYGIDITNATLQTYAYNLGLSKSVSEMTQAEKMQLRMLAILDQSKVSWGDLANTINSPSNMIRQFKNNLKETGMVLGQLFIPVLSKVLPVINGVAIAIKRLLVDIAGLLGIKIDLNAFGQGYSDIGDEIDDSADAFENATQKAKEYKNQILGFDEINKLTDQSTDSNASSDSGGIDLTKEITDATSEYEKVWNEAYNQMENKANEFAKRFEKSLEPIKKIINDFAIGDYLSAGEDVSDLVIDINNFVADAIEKVDWKGIGKKVGEFLKGIKWLEVFKSIGNVISSAIKGAVEFWFTSLDEAPFETALITAIGVWKFTKFGTKMSEKIGESVTKAISESKTIGTLTSAGKLIGKYIFAGIAAAITGWNLGQTIYEWISGETIDMSFTEQMKYLVDAFFTDDSDISNKVNPVINSVQNLLNSIKDFSNIDLQKIADDYYALSQKTQFTEDEIKQLGEYKALLEEYGLVAPGYIEKGTNAWKGTTEELDKAIKQTKRITLGNMINSLKSEQQNVKNTIDKLKDGLGDAFDYFESLDESTLNRIFDLENKKDWSAIQSIVGLHIGDEEITAYKKILQLEKQNKSIEQEKKRLSEEYNDLLDEEMRTMLGLNKQQKEGMGALENSLRFINCGVTEFKANVENTSTLDINTTNANNKIDETQSKKDKLTTNTTSSINFTTNIKSTTATINQKKDSIKTSLSQINTKFNFSLANITTFNQSLANFVTNTNKTLSKIHTKIEMKSLTGSNAGSLLANSLLKGITGLKISSSSPALFEISGVPRYAKGGLPEDGWFRASKGEYFGQFDDGTSYIANNNQIEAGIAIGVEEAAYRGITRAMAESQRDTKVNITLQGDTKKIFKAVQSEANNYVMQTGKPAFSF